MHYLFPIPVQVFSEESNGEDIEWFNKRERFHNTLFGYTMWDMVQNFGFRTLEDGTLECYQTGEYFHGNLPIVSQVVMMVFKIHARWLAWSTEHHINHYAFTANTEEEEEWEELSRKKQIGRRLMSKGPRRPLPNSHPDRTPDPFGNTVIGGG